jgi:hypothetical protein
MADPEEYRTKEQVAEWRKRDPINLFADRLEAESVLADEEREKLDKTAIEAVDDSVVFADASPFPEPDSLYDDVYVLGDQVRGWYSVDERTPVPHRGEDEREMPKEQLPGGKGYDRSMTGEGGPGPADEAQDSDDDSGERHERQES